MDNEPCIDWCVDNVWPKWINEYVAINKNINSNDAHVSEDNTSSDDECNKGNIDNMS